MVENDVPIDRRATSSDALVMKLPEDKRPTDVCAEEVAFAIFACAKYAEILVLIELAMVILLHGMLILTKATCLLLPCD